MKIAKLQRINANIILTKEINTMREVSKYYRTEELSPGYKKFMETPIQRLGSRYSRYPVNSVYIKRVNQVRPKARTLHLTKAFINNMPYNKVEVTTPLRTTQGQPWRTTQVQYSEVRDIVTKLKQVINDNWSNLDIEIIDWIDREESK